MLVSTIPTEMHLRSVAEISPSTSLPTTIADPYLLLFTLVCQLQETPTIRFVQGYAGAVSAALGIAVS